MNSNTFKFIRLILFIMILIVIPVSMTACWADVAVRLTVENQLPTDVTLIFNEYSSNNSSPTYTHNLGTAPAGQTVKTAGVIGINGISVMPKLTLLAEDSSGKIVWEHTWTGEEFVKLKDVGWKVVVSPETNS